MELRFAKWEGTGNDFVLVDDREGLFPTDDLDLVRRLCDRHFGIGSDGLVLIQRPKEEGTDYHMGFFNPDGSQSFCGNGSRCAFGFWRALSNGPDHAGFTAIDGRHDAQAMDGGWTGVRMRPPSRTERLSDTMDFIHTGSPHLLIWVDDPEAVDILPAAREHRYGPRFKADGVNVNFLAWRDGRLHMRTYERGVENETLSCGTGVTAAALSAIGRGLATGDTVEVVTRGGPLRVEVGGSLDKVMLIGPAREVFQGTIDV